MAETLFWVTPAAFAQWLHTQGQEPSPHVAAWFKAKGVAWPPGAKPSGEDSAAALPLVPWPSPGTAPVAPNKRKNWKAQAPEWTGERLMQKRRELKVHNPTQELARMTGLPNREITRREEEARKNTPSARGAA